MLEIHRPHRLVLPVGEAVGMQRNERAADNDEKTEGDPGTHEEHQLGPGQLREMPLRVGKRVDNAPEQDGLDEHRTGKREVRQGKHPAQGGLAPKQFEHAHVEMNKLHGFPCRLCRSVDRALGKWRQKRIVECGCGIRFGLERINKPNLVDGLLQPRWIDPPEAIRYHFRREDVFPDGHAQAFELDLPACRIVALEYRLHASSGRGLSPEAWVKHSETI